MSDYNINEIFQDEGLPNTLSYILKKSGAGSKSFQVKYPSTRSEYVGGISNTISVPVQTGVPNQYLDTSQSYLSFRITNNSIDATGTSIPINLDGSANCIFKRYELYGANGSQQLKDTQNYNTIYNVMLDSTVPLFQRSLYYNALIGTGAGVLDGDDFRLGEELPSDSQKTYNVNLMCSFMNGEKYLPLNAIKNGDIEMRFQLDDASNCLISANNNDLLAYTVDEVVFHAEIIELDSDNQRLVELSSGGVYAWSGEEYINHSINASSSKTQNILCPFRKGSVKTIYSCIRKTDDLSAPNKASLNNRQRAYMDQYQFSFGNVQIPPTPVLTRRDEAGASTQVMTELLRSFHNLNTMSGGLLSEQSFKKDNDNFGSFVIGCESESYSHKSDVIQCGLDTSNTNIYFKGLFSPPVGDNTMHIYDFWCHYDCIWIVDSMGNLDIRS